MVKRYCLVRELGSGCNCDIKEHNIGAFVSSRDYGSLERERDALSEKYNELLYCVANKYEGETRHETAKRIILNNQSNKGAGESEKGASQ